VNAPNYLGLTSDLVGFWSFDGKTVVGMRTYDQSGQGNHGTLTGSNGVPVRTAGKLGQALQFDGVDDDVDEGSGTSLDNITTKTISAWIKPDSVNAVQWGTIVAKQDNAFGTTIWDFALVGASSNYLRFVQGYNLSDNEWSTVVLDVGHFE
jgi:hypothetical protein